MCCDCWEVADLDSTLRLAPDRPRTRLQAGPALTRHQPQTAASHNQTSCFSCFSSFSFFSSFSSFSPFSSSSSCFSSSSYCSSSPLQRPPPASCSSANAICATPLTVGCSPVAANYCHRSNLSKKYCHCLLGEKNSLLPPRGDHLPNIAKKILVRGSKNMPSAQMTSNGRLLVQ